MTGPQEAIHWSGIGTRADTVAVVDSYVGAVARWRKVRLYGALGGCLSVGLFLLQPDVPWGGVAAGVALALLLLLWRPLRRFEGRVITRLMVPKNGIRCDFSVSADQLVGTVAYERRAWARRVAWGSFRAWYEFDGALILMPRTTIYLWSLPLRGLVDAATEAQLRELVARKLPHSEENQRFADNFRDRPTVPS